VDISQNRLCKNCVAAKAISKVRVVGGGDYNHGFADDILHTGGGKGKKFSKFWIFCFGVLPGLAYMYMGLLKRGIITMGAFAASIYLITISGWFTFLLLTVIFGAFFDSFRKRDMIADGIPISDEVDDVIAPIRNHKFLILATIAVIFLLEFGGRFFASFFNPFPAILIALGVYFLFIRKKK